MKIIHVKNLIDSGGFSQTKEWEKISNHIIQAIKAVQWPSGSGSFTLYPEKHGNGVKPIKEACMLKLESLDWSLETRVDIATVVRPGPMDATYPVGGQLFCVEWETGNISSSHRAVNKMALGILQGILIGGALILPVRSMYEYLTDRVGNYRELKPYFPLWKALNVEQGFLIIIAIEHDGVSESVPRIPKGTDGRALL